MNKQLMTYLSNKIQKFQNIGKQNLNKIYLNQLNKDKFQNINKDMKIKEIMMEILYVIIFGIMVFMYHMNGKMNNIGILKQNKMNVEKL